MMGISVIAMLLVLGGAATVIALIALAVSKGRPGIAILVGGLAFLGLLSAVAVLFMFMAYSRATVPQAINSFSTPQIETPHWTINGVPQAPPMSLTRDNPTWTIALTPMIFIVVGVIALLFLVARRGLAHSAGGHGRIWPAFLALPVLALLFFGSIRYQSSTRHDFVNRGAQVKEMVQKQQQTIATQQQELAHRVAAVTAHVHHQIDKLDIHELMDSFDAPRIALQAPMAPSAAPAALIAAAAAPTNVAPPAPPIPPTPPDARKTNSTNESAANGEKIRPRSKQKRPTKSVDDVAKLAKAETKSGTVEKPEAITGIANDPKSIDFPSIEKSPFKAIAKAGQSAATRPAWVDEPPKKTGDTRREVIATEEYETADECYLAADVYLLLKTYEHVQLLADQPFAESALPSITFQNGLILADNQIIATGRTRPEWADTRPRYLKALGIGTDYIRREIVAKDPANHNDTREYLETVDRSFGPMKKLYVQMEFTPAIDREIRQMLDVFERRSRFGAVGFGAASILGVLSTVWGLLKIDTATKGYYTKWLFIGIPAAIIGVTLASVLAIAA